MMNRGFNVLPILRAAGLLLCLALAAGGCGGLPPDDGGAFGEIISPEDSVDFPESEISQKADADTLVYAMNAEPAALDPQNDFSANAMLVNKQIYNTLVVRDEVSGELLPGLAAAWEWQDETTLAVTLREEVYFHNGDKMTAEDVLFTIRRFPGSAAAALFSVFDGENSEAIDDTHVEIRLHEAYGGALNLLTSMKAAIVSQNYAQAAGEAALGRQPVGTGPFQFTGWIDGDRIILERNEAYWARKPTFKNLIMRVIPEEADRVMALENGGADIISTLNAPEVARYANDNTPGVNFYSAAGYELRYLAFNDEDPIFSKEKVRLAIAQAMEPGAIAEAGLGVFGRAAQSSLPMDIFGFKHTGPYEYNVEKARILLEEAGYPYGFRCELMVPDVAGDVRIGEAIQAYLGEIGITVSVRPLDAAAWQAMCREGGAQLALLSLTADAGDPDRSYGNLAEDGENQAGRSSDPEVNRLLLEGRTGLDPEQRRAVYGQLQDYIFAKAIWLPVCESVANYATKDYVLNFVPDAGGQVDLRRISIHH
jgi:peptide/nickel transport system substrate-binding protein